jgi:hypothetical protein
MVFIVSTFGCAPINEADYILKTGRIKNVFRDSVEIGGSDYSGITYISIPIVVVATAEEDAVVPQPINKDDYNQKFRVEEKISGEVDSTGIFTYTVFPSYGDRIIKKNEKIIGILKKYKTPREYMLLTAVSYNDSNKKEILKNLRQFLKWRAIALGEQ